MIQHVLAVVARLSHALVEVVERGVRHLKRLGRDGSDATQVSLVALILENGFLTLLDLVLLLQLLDQ